ncbi:hypothetical protein [Halobacillus sp. H74]|uniref:hypothetical protein n=1 Tax=Halobacillus sp. H74 TaxID=3457436 RepID=UPI003FCEB650
MKKANAVFMILSGLMIFQNFIAGVGGILMGVEQPAPYLMLGMIPLIIWIAILVLSEKKKDVTPFTLSLYIGLIVLFGIHFYLLFTEPSYGFSKIIAFFGA